MPGTYSDDSYTTYHTYYTRSTIDPALRREMAEKLGKAERKSNGPCDCFWLWCLADSEPERVDDQTSIQRQKHDDISFGTYDDFTADDSSFETRDTSFRGGRLSRRERDLREFREFQRWKRQQRSSFHTYTGNDYHGGRGTMKHHDTPPRDLYVHQPFQYPASHHREDSYYVDYPKGHDAVSTLRRGMSPDTTDDKYHPNSKVHAPDYGGNGRDAATSPLQHLETTYPKSSSSSSLRDTISGQPSPQLQSGSQGKKGFAKSGASIVSAETRVIRNTRGDRTSKSARSESATVDSRFEDLPHALTRSSTISSMTSVRESDLGSRAVSFSDSVKIGSAADIVRTPEPSEDSRSSKQQILKPKERRFRAFGARKRYSTPAFERAASFDCILENEEEFQTKEVSPDEKRDEREETYHNEEAASMRSDGTCSDIRSCDLNSRSTTSSGSNRNPTPMAQHWNHIAGGGAIFHSIAPVASSEGIELEANIDKSWQTKKTGTKTKKRGAGRIPRPPPSSVASVDRRRRARQTGAKVGNAGVQSVC